MKAHFVNHRSDPITQKNATPPTQKMADEGLRNLNQDASEGRDTILDIFSASDNSSEKLISGIALEAKDPEIYIATLKVLKEGAGSATYSALAKLGLNIDNPVKNRVFLSKIAESKNEKAKKLAETTLSFSPDKNYNLSRISYKTAFDIVQGSLRGTTGALLAKAGYQIISGSDELNSSEKIYSGKTYLNSILENSDNYRDRIEARIALEGSVDDNDEGIVKAYEKGLRIIQNQTVKKPVESGKKMRFV
jgi:hypothetical protein